MYDTLMFLSVEERVCLRVKIQKHPFGKASRWGVFVSDYSKRLVDTRDEVFEWAADLNARDARS